MANIKTAISMNKNLFEQANQLADELEVSRSHLFVLALEAFIQRYENERLLHQINQAYDDLPLADEERFLQGMKSSQRKLTQGEW